MTMQFNRMQPDTMMDDIEVLSILFNFKFSVTNDVVDGAIAQYTKHHFLGMEHDYIDIKPEAIEKPERLMAVFFHEFGHLLDINLHGDADTPSQEIIASFVSIFLTTVFHQNLSQEAIGVLAATISMHGYDRDNENINKYKAYECIKAFYAIMTDGANVEFCEFDMIIEEYRKLMTKILMVYDGDVNEAFRCMA